MPEQNQALPSDAQHKLSIHRNRIWLMTYVSLFTSLLAFFVLIITITEMEGVAPKRAYQKVMNGLYQEVSAIQKANGLDWMRVENTFSKGVRVSLDPQLFANSPLFEPARAELNPRFYPYLDELAKLVNELDVQNFNRKYQRWIRAIEGAGLYMDLTFRVEGHTDANPLAVGARYRDNIELSTYRAYALMNYLQSKVSIHPSIYSVAGYGSFHPVLADDKAAENRRIEFYIVPQMLSTEPKTIIRDWEREQ